MNEDRTSPNSDTPVTQPRSPAVPTHYELIDKDGNVVGRYSSILKIHQEVADLFPDQEQDEERSGRGLGCAGRGGGSWPR